MVTKYKQNKCYRSYKYICQSLWQVCCNNKMGVSIDLGGFNKSSRNNFAILLMGFYDVINKMFSHNTQVLSTLFSPFHRANSLRKCIQANRSLVVLTLLFGWHYSLVDITFWLTLLFCWHYFLVDIAFWLTFFLVTLLFG